MKKLLLYLILTIGLVFASCESDPFGSGTNYNFKISTDTVSFDTVFTTINSVTLNFKIFNKGIADLEIEEIRLIGGDGSAFRLNIDGVPGGIAENITLSGGDSMFIFVEAKLDMNNTSNPLIINDSILIRSKEKQAFVKLLAYGQDVEHMRASGEQDYVYLDDAKTVKAVYFKDFTLTNQKPYLFHDHVYVDSGYTLNVDPGVTIYMKSGKSLFIGGSLKMNGTLEDPITVRGDRLDKVFDGLAYDKIDGQWGFIYLLAGSLNNEIYYANIRNSEYGVIVDTVMTPDAPTLKISHSRIENVSKTALVGRGASIQADNCLFANCGEFVLAFIIGGSYELDHCTIGNYYNSFFSSRKDPAVLLNNFYVDADENVQARHLEKAWFKNCIIYGDFGSNYEVALNNSVKDVLVNAEFDYLFDHCLIKGGSELDTTDIQHFRDIIWDKDPQFVAPKEKADYRLDTTSVARNAGSVEIANNFPLDIVGVNRLKDEGPDLGAFEFTLEDE